jgi:hypothetical protein
MMSLMVETERHRMALWSRVSAHSDGNRDTFTFTEKGIGDSDKETVDEESNLHGSDIHAVKQRHLNVSRAYAQANLCLRINVSTDPSRCIPKQHHVSAKY